MAVVRTDFSSLTQDQAEPHDVLIYWSPPLSFILEVNLTMCKRHRNETAMID